MSRLDRGAVVTSALDLVDRDGLDALTIRRLAQQLEVSPMALYWHFADKEALLGGISERLWRDVAAELDGTGEGWDGLRAITSTLVSVLRRHPAAATLAPMQVTTCGAGLAVCERTLELLARQGFDEEHGAQMAFLLLLQAVALVGAQPGSGPASGQGPGTPADDDHLRHKRLALASLPPDAYPRTVAAAEYLADCAEPQVFFDRGIDMVVAGIRQQSPEVVA